MILPVVEVYTVSRFHARHVSYLHFPFDATSKKLLIPAESAWRKGSSESSRLYKFGNFIGVNGIIYGLSTDSILLLEL